MADLQAEIEALRRRLRLRTLFFFGALFVTAASLGGARAAVRVFTESDAWIVATREDPGSGTDKINRLIVSGDVDVSRIRIEEANVHLAQQSSAPSSPNPGALWYDSSAGRLKYRGPSSWMEPGANQKLVYKAADESILNVTTLQDDDHLKFAIGANERWAVDFWVVAESAMGGPNIKFAVIAPSGSTVQYWTWFDESQRPPYGVTCQYAASGGTALRSGLDASGPYGYMLHAVISNGSTAGDVVLQWAKNSAGSQSTTVKAGSALEATRIP